MLYLNMVSLPLLIVAAGALGIHLGLAKRTRAKQQRAFANLHRFLRKGYLRQLREQL